MSQLSQRPADPVVGESHHHESAFGHITGAAVAETYQPMNVNFGLFPPVEAKSGRRGRKDRYPAYTDRAKQDFSAWLSAQ